jgi:hypothetical protein
MSDGTRKTTAHSEKTRRKVTYDPFLPCNVTGF